MLLCLLVRGVLREVGIFRKQGAIVYDSQVSRAQRKLYDPAYSL